MFKAGRDDVATPLAPCVLCQAKDGQIVRLRRPAREDHLIGISFDNGRHLIARLLHGFLCPRPMLVRPAAGISDFLAEISAQHLGNRRLKGGRGVAIEIHRSGFVFGSGHKRMFHV
jgi:hypothetical protein